MEEVCENGKDITDSMDELRRMTDYHIKMIVDTSQRLGLEESSTKKIYKKGLKQRRKKRRLV